MKIWDWNSDQWRAGKMINYIPPAFYESLVVRGQIAGCNNGDCSANATEVVNTARNQWDKLSAGAKVGIIVGAAVGATLLVSVAICCLWRWCRKRRDTGI